MDNMIPRITIPDEQDVSLVMVALAECAETLAQRIRMGGGDSIKALARTTELMNCIWADLQERHERAYADDIESEAAKAHDDDEIRKHFGN